MPGKASLCYSLGDGEARVESVTLLNGGMLAIYYVV